MRYFFIILLSFSFTLNWAQNVTPGFYNYGKVKDWNNPVSVFKYTNTSSQKQIFLPIAYQPNVKVQFEKLSLEAGESCTIYLFYYTEEFGKFTEEFNIFVNTSPNPIKVSIQGYIKSFHPEAFTRCPLIENGEIRTSPTFEHTIKVVDSISGITINDYDLVIAQGEVEEKRVVDRSMLNKNGGLVLTDLNPNLYKIRIRSEGYHSAELLVYLNRYTKETIVYLSKDSFISIGEDIEPIIDSAQVEIITIPEAIDTSTFTREGILNNSLYKYNHLVFVIDVSSSMDKEDKLPLLKYSMARLVEVLRPEDKLTLITYSGNVNVILSEVSGSDKQTILDAIMSLEAKGSSHGDEALSMAYDLAKASFINDGNNEIILASDGLFNSSNFKEQKVYRKALIQYKKNQIRVSTIAFGRTKSALQFMQQTAKYGGGNYLLIPDENTARSVLIQNLLAHSLKD